MALSKCDIIVVVLRVLILGASIKGMGTASLSLGVS